MEDRDLYIRLIHIMLEEMTKVFGTVTLSLIKHIEGVEVSADGSLNVTGDCKLILDKVLTLYESFAGGAMTPDERRRVQELLTQNPNLEVPTYLQEILNTQ